MDNPGASLGRPASDAFQDVQKYYDCFYSTTDLHYAHWDSRTRSAQAAIQNTNRAVCDLLQIRRGDLVLDAGCGLGGTSIYIALERGARVEGIDASQIHVDRARRNAARANVLELATFSLQDHRHTSFAPGRFDHVIAIESVLASDSAVDFLREAHRVLKPGGKIAIMTLNLLRSSAGAPIFKKRHAGHIAFQLNLSKEEFCVLIEREGFCQVHALDLTSRIRPPSRTLLVLPMLLVLALSKLRVLNAAIGAHIQTLLETDRAMAKGEVGMSAFVANA